MQRARALSLMSRTMAGSSFQNARFMEFIASSRFMRMWATPSSRVTSKQVHSRLKAVLASLMALLPAKVSGRPCTP